MAFFFKRQVEPLRARLARSVEDPDLRESVVRRLPLAGIDVGTAGHYARIRAGLERQGAPIGANDLWIAAQALNLGATLVTDNQREFQRVAGLSLENWLS